MKPWLRFCCLSLLVITVAVAIYGCQSVTRSGSSNNSDPSSPSAASRTPSPGTASDPPSPATAKDPPSPSTALSATTDLATQIDRLNHIVILIQENRSFDHYFGLLNQYWTANGFPSQPFDGLPLLASNPGCDPAVPPDVCLDSKSPQIQVYHLRTACTEALSPIWGSSHSDFNVRAPTSDTATLDGFVANAFSVARSFPWIHDKAGRRAMGYYDGHDLNYYYFMASNFATSDRWFSPLMSSTEPNRMYLLAATSHGHIYPLAVSHGPRLGDKTIFQLLEEHGISWKIYVHPGPRGCVSTSCLLALSAINMFTFEETIGKKLPQRMAPISQYFRDVANGTLPQVALIERASPVSLDEHPAVRDPVNIQAGARYVSSLINALMRSPSWKDSVFILSYDEFGGFYDHVPPRPAVSPDGIPPLDILPTEVCAPTGGANCDFKRTGFRVPLIVISPFTKKNFVSHTPADYTAILKLIERRFNLPSLTARDAAQMDMTEFFDFTNPPWMTPPTPPAQNVLDSCYLNRLP